MTYFEKRFRSYRKINTGSVGQRAVKLLAVKVGGPSKKSAASAITAEVCANWFSLGSSPPRVESFSKFDRQ